jgi:glycosyltransferase involved in cell wall biosynthesis
MAYGKPVIATNVGGIPSLVKNGFNGWIIEPWELYKIDGIFDEIFKDPELLVRQGTNSYLAAQEYNPIRMFQKIEHVYDDLINNEY